MDFELKFDDDGITEESSSRLKGAFKAQMESQGLVHPTDLPAELSKLAEEYPNEWDEACEEFEQRNSVTI